MTMQMEDFSSPAVRESLGSPTRPLFLQLDCSSSGPRTRNRTLGIQGRCGWEASLVPGGAHCVKPCTWEGEHKGLSVPGQTSNLRKIRSRKPQSAFKRVILPDIQIPH